MGLPNGYLGRAMFLYAIVLAAHVAPLGAVVDTPVLIEGFEKAFATEPDAKVKTVTSGPGLTQGKSAAELNSGGAIAVKRRRPTACAASIRRRCMRSPTSMQVVRLRSPQART